MTVKSDTAHVSALFGGIDSFVVRTSTVVNSHLRLDGSYFNNEGFEATWALERSGYEIVPMKRLARTFTGARFKRVHVEDAENGIPYLSPSDMFDAKLRKSRFLSKRYTGDIDGLRVQPDWTLITCSGTIGRCIFVNDELTEFVLTHDVIRVVPHSDGVPPGYLYAYLSSPVGKSLLIRNTYGKVVDHIEPHHVDRVHVPLIEDDVQNKIHNLVVAARAKRTEANQLLDEADRLVYEVCHLPRVNNQDRRWKDEALAFDTSSTFLQGRLDASFHQPIATFAEQAVKSSPAGFQQLGDMADKVFQPNIFKRPYVEPGEHGVPFLTSADIINVRQKVTKYVSRLMPNISDYQVESGWILIQRSGSVGGVIGRPALVLSSLQRSVVTEDLIRVVVADELQAGFIFAFLSSEIGYSLIIRNAFGSAQGHLDVNQIKRIPIPIPHPEDRGALGLLVVRAHQLRAEANQLEDDAEELLMNALSNGTAVVI